VFEALKRREDANGLIQFHHKPQFLPGDKVGVLDGAFQDWLGLYEGMTSNERVTILLEFLGRKVRVNLDSEMLIAV
jgi:transcriptional antiterminator RfaH